MPTIITWHTEFISFFIFGGFLVLFLNMLMDEKCEYYEVVVSSIIIFGGFFLHAYLWSMPELVRVTDLGFAANWFGGFTGIFLCETLLYSHNEYLRDEHIEEQTIISVNQMANKGYRLS